VQSLNNIRIKPKLISLFLLVGFIPIVIISWFAEQHADKSLMQSSFNQLESVRDIKKRQLTNYFDSVVNSIDVLEMNVKNIKTEAYNKLEAVTSIKKAQLEEYFYYREIDVTGLSNNPNTINALTDFNDAFVGDPKNPVGNEDWTVTEEQYGSWFAKYFLISHKAPPISEVSLA
jgi:methyl-accepting chemotaxis protein